VMVEVSDRIWREVAPEEPEADLSAVEGDDAPLVDAATGEITGDGFTEADDLPVSLDD